MELFDPRGRGRKQKFKLVERFENLNGLTFNILNSNKKYSDDFLYYLVELLEEEYGARFKKMINKEKPTTPASEEKLSEAISGVDFILAGVGD